MVRPSERSTSRRLRARLDSVRHRCVGRTRRVPAQARPTNSLIACKRFQGRVGARCRPGEEGPYPAGASRRTTPRPLWIVHPRRPRTTCSGPHGRLVSSRDPASNTEGRRFLPELVDRCRASWTYGTVTQRERRSSPGRRSRIAPQEAVFSPLASRSRAGIAHVLAKVRPTLRLRRPAVQPVSNPRHWGRDSQAIGVWIEARRLFRPTAWTRSDGPLDAP
jgi:hypothetical protein